MVQYVDGLSQFSADFKLSMPEGISDFFPAHKSIVREKMAAKIRRFSHYVLTGIWINEDVVCEWAKRHAEVTISALLEGKEVQRKVVRYETHMVPAKPSLLQRCKSSVGFLFEHIRHPGTVGALFPSSGRLAKSIVDLIPQDSKAAPRRILEVGPGTGVFTRKILRRMNPRDTLVLVEYDEKFYAELKKMFGHIPNVEIVKEDIVKYTSIEKFDYIVSGLPLNSFSEEFVQNVFSKFVSLSPKGCLSYFDYKGLPKFKRLYLATNERRKFDAILWTKSQFFKNHGLREECVWFNFPPARVLHHQLGSQ